jgi:NAD(P)-dependent dehydrogenase (short-subunit alcohol dehydrogenase family)
MLRFDDAKVIVTGAAHGIGKAIVEGFLGAGAEVLAVDIDAAGLKTLAAALDSDRVHTMAADLGDPDQARRMIEQGIAAMSRIDVLVNDAAVMPSRAILDIDEDEWRQVFDVNVGGPFWAMQAVARHMIERGGGGAVVNIASANAFRIESPEAHYNASKAALVSLTRSFAHELGHHGIRFNCVAPGETVTSEEAASMTPEDIALERVYVERIPMRRVAHAAEQAAAVLFLASDEASFISGQTLIVDGGELTGDWFDPADKPPVPTQWFE